MLGTVVAFLIAMCIMAVRFTYIVHHIKVLGGQVEFYSFRIYTHEVQTLTVIAFK